MIRKWSSRVVNVLFVGLLGSAPVAALGAEATAAAEEPATLADGDTMEPAVQVGITPQLSLSGAYHSNPYYRSDENANGAYVLSVDPGLSVGLPISEFVFIGFDGKVNITHVAFTSGGTDEDKTVVQPYVSGKIRYNPTESTSCILHDDFQVANVEDDLNGPRFYLNNAIAQAAQEFGGRFVGTVDYKNTILQQEDESLLFDSMENSVGASCSAYVAPTESGRRVALTLLGRVGRKDFEEGDFYLQTSRDNPKTHNYHELGAGVTYPLSALMSLDGRGGWRHREYEVTSGARKEKSDTPFGGLTLSFTPSPGSPLSFTFANSYEVTDTVVYNIPQVDRVVFETTDPLLNNLDIQYRELDVWRSGLAADYRLSDQWQLGLSSAYQRAQADDSEDLAPISGNVGDQSGVGDSTDREQVTVGLTVRYHVTENASLGLGYQHGYGRDKDSAGEEDDYAFDSVALLGKIDLL